MTLDDMLKKLAALSPAEHAEAVAAAVEGTKALAWVPNPGPQSDAYFSEADELFFGGSAGGGKGLALGTLLPTPMGWVSMGEVAVGSVLFDDKGEECRVTAVSETTNRPCFALTFDDGSTIIADDVHRWVTFDAKARASLNPKGALRNTQNLADTLLLVTGEANHAIALFPLACKAKRLLHPPGRTTSFRYLVACDPVPSVPTRCLSVDSPTRLYLAGSGMIPTHNTDLEIGLALNVHKRSLILRRTHKEALGIVERIAEILGTRDGWNSQSGLWRLPDGRTIEISGCQLEEDKQKFKGIPHSLKCVGRGTPVLMADSNFKAVELIECGDSVMTLEGPRKVLRAFTTPPKQAIKVRVVALGGEVVSQVQSASHEVFSHAGWVSLGTPSVGRPSHAYSYAKVSRALGIFFSTVLRKCALASPVLGRTYPSGQNTELPVPVGTPSPYRLYLVDLTAKKGLLKSESECVGSGGAHARQPLPQKLTQTLIGLLVPFRCLVRPVAGFVTCLRDALREHSALAPVDYPCGYSSGFHRCGALLQRLFCPGSGSVCARAYPPPQDGVAPHIPIGSPSGDGDTAPSRNPRMLWYTHPYRMEPRQSILPMVDAVSYEVSPLGELSLFDLEVEEVNHFITYGGLINKNCHDELSDFSESQYLFINAWNRSADPKERCRLVSAGNPPTRPEGLWVVKRWAAWLDPQHPNPAQPGELRWYTMDGKREIEVDGRGPHIVDGEEVLARSRTFIPSWLTDNPDLAETGYKATLDSLPEELRAAYRDGNFGTSLQDDAFQAIPTSWVREAQNRWTKAPPVGVPMCAIGVDIAQGGKDQTVLAIRHDGWYNTLVSVPGEETPDGKTVSGLVVKHRRDGARVVVDIGGGWGGDAYAHLRENGIDAVSYMGVKSSSKRTVDKQVKFFNVRAEAYWRFREALDPSQPQGSSIMLPQDATMVADLCAPTYEIGSNGIKIESKEHVCRRLGRSTDKGDAVVMAWWDGLKQAQVKGGWSTRDRPTTAIMGRKRR